MNAIPNPTHDAASGLASQHFSRWLIALSGLWLLGLTVAYLWIAVDAVRQYWPRVPVAYGSRAAFAAAVLILCLLFSHWRWRHWLVTRIWLGGLCVLAAVLTVTTRHLLAAFVTGWLIALAYLWGAMLTARCKREPTDARSETFCLNVALGLALLALVAFILGVAHLLTPRSIAITLVAMTLGQTRAFIRLWRALGNHWLSFRVTDKTAFAFPEQGLLAVALGLIFLCNLGLALLPETRWDALSYQLAVPRMYLEHGQVVDLPSFWHSYFARLVNWLFAIALGLQGQTAAKLLVPATGLVTLAGTFALTQRLGDKRAAWWAATLFYATPLISWISVTAYVDLPLTMFLTASLLAFLRWRDRRDAGWLWCCGLLAGAALATKPTAGYGLILISCLIAVWLFPVSAPPLSKRLKWVTGYAVCLLLVAVPFYFVTYHQTGNPVFPLLNAVFKSPGWAAINERMNADTFGLGYTWTALLRLPFAFVFRSRLFDESHPAGSYGLLLLLCPLALWLRKTKGQLVALLLAHVGIFLWLWANNFQYGRYYAPIHPVVAALAIAGILSVPLTQRMAGARLLLLGSLLVAQGVLMPIANGDLLLKLPLRYWLGKESADIYLTRTLKGYEAVTYLNQHTQNSERIATSETEHLRFYLHAPLDTVVETRAMRSLLDIADERILAGEMYRRGYRYIWANTPDVFSRQPSLTFLRPGFLTHYATLEYENTATRIYRLKPPLPASP
jgi:hypothetical protein